MKQTANFWGQLCSIYLKIGRKSSFFLFSIFSVMALSGQLHASRPSLTQEARPVILIFNNHQNIVQHIRNSVFSGLQFNYPDQYYEIVEKSVFGTEDIIRGLRESKTRLVKGIFFLGFHGNYLTLKVTDREGQRGNFNLSLLASTLEDFQIRLQFTTDAFIVFDSCLLITPPDKSLTQSLNDLVTIAQNFGLQTGWVFASYELISYDWEYFYNSLSLSASQFKSIQIPFTRGYERHVYRRDKNSDNHGAVLLLNQEGDAYFFPTVHYWDIREGHLLNMDENQADQVDLDSIF